MSIWGNHIFYTDLGAYHAEITVGPLSNSVRIVANNTGGWNWRTGKQRLTDEQLIRTLDKTLLSFYNNNTEYCRSIGQNSTMGNMNVYYY